MSWGKSSFDACNLGKDVPIYDDHDADLAKESLDDADIVVTPFGWCKFDWRSKRPSTTTDEMSYASDEDLNV